jgi:hypothetical protein
LESAGRAGTGVDRRRSQGKGAESRPGLQLFLSCLFVFVFVFVFVLMGASGEASPAGYGQEAVIRCIYAMAAKRPHAI